jgi:hypothetical protein
VADRLHDYALQFCTEIARYLLIGPRGTPGFSTSASACYAEMSKFYAAEYLCGGWHSHSSFRQCGRVGMAIAAPPWSCTRNEACWPCAGLSMVDLVRLAVPNNSIVVS